MPIKIIHRDDERKFIVVDKPSSIVSRLLEWCETDFVFRLCIHLGGT